MRRTAAPTGRFALLPLALATSCGFLSAPATRFDLALEWAALTVDQPDLREWALTTLEQHFGVPTGPEFLVLEEWQDRGYDPNHPELAMGHGGSGEIDAEVWRRIQRDNRIRFEDELEDLSGERYDSIGPWSSAPDLSREWSALLADRGAPGLAERAESLLVDHYPSLLDSATLYAKRCLTCHGNEGGGNGSSSRFLNPAPRDFRQGVFKFTAVADHARPRRADLVRVIREGIQNTSMASFSGLSEAELNGLADYVRLLSMRGETELWWVDDLVAGEAPQDEDALEGYRAVFENWWEADTKEIPLGGGPMPATADILEVGRQLFHDTGKGNCATCHGIGGSGGGALMETTTFHDAWGDVIVPRDLTRGPFRYGNSPEDIYRRVYAGINGTPMPGIGGMRDKQGNPLVAPDEIWAIVHYVRELRGLSSPSGDGQG